MLPRFEYNVIPAPCTPARNKDELEQQAGMLMVKLNEYGKAGWELVADRNGVLIFKRQRPAHEHEPKDWV